MNGPCAVRLPLDCMTKRGSVSQAGRETGEPLFCPAWQLPSGRDPSSTGFSFCNDFPLCYRQETVAGILKKNRTGQELRIKNTFQKCGCLFAFLRKNAQLELLHSSAVLRSVVHSPVGRSSLVGVPRLSTRNNDIMMFPVEVAQIRKPYKKPAKPFHKPGFAGFCNLGGQ